MKARIIPSEISGMVIPPASKSAAHRALLAAFLCGCETELKGRIQGDDVRATAEIMTKFGAKISYTECGVRADCREVQEYIEKYKKDVDCGKCDILTLDCGESGSTLRFILPVLCALGVRVRLTGKGRLKERPLKDLIDVLNEHGAKIEGDVLPIVTGGKLAAGAYTVAADVSSQYITGLLYALPLCDGDSEIILRGRTVSAPYVRLTRKILSAFRVGSEEIKNGYRVRGSQRFVSPKAFAVEGDWSAAAFAMVAGALCGDVVVSGLDTDSIQGDKIILDILRRAGADVSETEDGIRVKKSRLKAFEYDCSDCPDTVPAVSVLAAAAEGMSRIYGAERLRAKESDRLAAVIEMLSAFGIKSGYDGGCLVIEGGVLKGARTHGHSDHRMAMSAIVAAFAADGESEVEGTECTAKSYPDFAEDMTALKGRIYES